MSTTTTPNPKVIYDLYDFQVEPVRLLSEKIETGKGSLLISPVGTGKTIMLLEALKRVIPNMEFNGDKIMILCPKKAIIQWTRFSHDYGLDNIIEIYGHEELRSSIGELYISWPSKMIDGEIQVYPVWDKPLPRLLIIDEIHKAKNHLALLSQILENYIDQGGQVISASATPFVLMSETYIISRILNIASDREDWRILLKHYCGDLDPLKPHPTIMKRFNDDLVDLGKIIKTKKIRFKKKLKTIFTRIEMHERKRPIYERAYIEFLERVRYANGLGDIRDGRLARAVAILQFRKVCEALRADDIAKQALLKRKEGYQVLMFFNFKPGLFFTIKMLKRLGVDMNDISVVIGGQSNKNRQAEIDKFQAGKTHYFLSTLKSGGEALNLQHDGKYPGQLPRWSIIGVTWSAVDFIQGGGRHHRINSITNSFLEVMSYIDTIEDRVIDVLESKNTSIAELIGKRASFASIFMSELDKSKQAKDEYIVEEDTDTEKDEDGYDDVDKSPVDALFEDEPKQINEIHSTALVVTKPLPVIELAE